MADPIKKTGATPIVEEGIEAGRVEGAVPVHTVLVKYTDGHGVASVKLAAVIPGGEIYFFDKAALDLRPAQQWLKKAVVAAIAEKKPSGEIEQG